jgi:signal transduction histidine kinase/CheY-like chemotaxis protein
MIDNGTAAPSGLTTPPMSEDAANSSGAPWEVMQTTVMSVAILTCGLGYLLAAYAAVAFHATPRWDVFLPAAILTGGGTAVLVWRTRYRARAALIVTVLFVACLLCDIISRDPQAQLSYLLVCIVAGVLLGPLPATGVAITATAALIGQTLLLPQGSIPWESLVHLWSAVAVVWVTVGNLYHAVNRALASADAAWMQVREARVRRGELHSVVRSLEEATYRIERMNHELNQARMEAELAKANKSRFVVTVSHELRGPLNLILGFSRMMALSPERYGVPLPPAYRADMDAVYRNSEHMASLVDDVIDLARIEAERLPLLKEPVDLCKDVVSEAVDIVRPLVERKGLYLRETTEGEVPTILADPVRLRQVLLNLLVNAVRHTEQGGITVTTELHEEYVSVSVCDTGIGIAPDDIPQLFQEFSQVAERTDVDQPGSGLGLSISKCLVELHGGEMHVESTQGVGTSFRFTLPLPGIEVPAPTTIRTAATKKAQPTETCLIVHDDPLVVRLLARHLDSYHVVGASEPENVDTLIAELRPRAIIAPPEVAEAVEQRITPHMPDIPIIACPIVRDTDGPEWKGIVGYLIKPITREMLWVALKKVVHNGRTRILIVDDDLDAVRLLEAMLTALPYDYEIMKAYDGGQALNVMREVVPDVVLLDLVMPNVDGAETLARMQADRRLQHVPVIVISATDSADESMAMATPITIRQRQSLDLTRGVRCLKALVDALPPRHLAAPEPAAPPQEASRG